VSQIKYDLDELRPFSGDKGALIECVVYGEATIEFDGAGEWRVAAITIDVFRGEPFRIFPPHPLWAPICSALRKQDDERITNRIVDVLEGCGVVFADSNAEHSTMNHHDQGLAR
jgi:hypothetical protein